MIQAGKKYKDGKNTYHTNTDQKKAGIAIRLDKAGFKAKTSARIKRSLCCEIVAGFILGDS